MGAYPGGYKGADEDVGGRHNAYDLVFTPLVLFLGSPSQRYRDTNKRCWDVGQGAA